MQNRVLIAMVPKVGSPINSLSITEELVRVTGSWDSVDRVLIPFTR